MSRVRLIGMLMALLGSQGSAQAFEYEPCADLGLGSMLGFKPMHEEITARAYGFGTGIDGRRKIEPEILRGLLFNDDPHGWTFNLPVTNDYNCQLLIASKYFNVGINDYKRKDSVFSFSLDLSALTNKNKGFNKAALGAHSLVLRSHYQDLSFWHFMSGHHGESAAEVQRKALLWFHLADEARRSPNLFDRPLSKLTMVPSLARLFQRPDADWSLCEFRGPGTSDNKESDKIYNAYCLGIRSKALRDATLRNILCQTTVKEDRCVAEQRMLGTLLHLVQDSYSSSHTERVDRAIKQTFFYGDQSAEKHGRADRCEEWQRSVGPSTTRESLRPYTQKNLSFAPSLVVDKLLPCIGEAIEATRQVIRLYASSRANLVQAMRQGPLAVAGATDADQLASLKNRLSKALQSKGATERELVQLQGAIAALRDQMKDLKEALNRIREQAPIGCEVLMEHGVYRLRFSETVLFDSGKVEIKREGRAALDKIMALLEKELPHPFNGRLWVSGHTDPKAMSRPTDCMPDNWHLSARRAARVVRYLLSKAPQTRLAGQLVAAGYADTSTTGKGDENDRRVDIDIQADNAALFQAIDNLANRSSLDNVQWGDAGRNADRSPQIFSTGHWLQ